MRHTGSSPGRGTHVATQRGCAEQGDSLTPLHGRAVLPCLHPALMLALLLALLQGLFAARAPGAEPKDPFAVKAAFLCNFAKFTEWPADAFKAASSPFVIGILGEDPFGGRIDSAAKGLTLHGRAVTIRRLAGTDGLAECQLVFLGSDYARRLSEVLGLVGKSPVLLVGDTRDFAASGGTIGFVEKDSAIHFEVNLGAAGTAGLKLNSGMLKLADKVHQAPKGGA